MFKIDTAPKGATENRTRARRTVGQLLNLITAAALLGGGWFGHTLAQQHGHARPAVICWAYGDAGTGGSGCIDQTDRITTWK